MNKKYKETFSAIRPSDKAVERLMGMTNRENKKRIGLAPVVALVASFAILITSLFAGGVFKNDEKIDGTSQTLASVVTEKANSFSKVAPGFVMVAYANETENINVVDINNIEPSTPFICQIGAVDIKGKSQKEINRIASEIRNKFQHLEGENEQGKVYYCMSTNTDIYDDAVIYEAYCGNFNFDLNDDEIVNNVKEIRVSNKNKNYGFVQIQANDVYYNDDLTMKNDNINYDKSAYLSNQDGEYASLSGKRYQKCYALGKSIGGVKKYFGVNWKINKGLYKALNETPNFDLTKVNDTLTFEVEFNDGTVSKSVIDIAFTKDGKMYAVGSCYDFVE